MNWIRGFVSLVTGLVMAITLRWCSDAPRWAELMLALIVFNTCYGPIRLPGDSKKGGE